MLYKTSAEGSFDDQEQLTQVSKANLDLVYLFRNLTLMSKAVIFDFSWNHFSDEYMQASLPLIKLCSSDLLVLNL
jgi:hypothetical protein